MMCFEPKTIAPAKEAFPVKKISTKQSRRNIKKRKRKVAARHGKAGTWTAQAPTEYVVPPTGYQNSQRPRHLPTSPSSPRYVNAEVVTAAVGHLGDETVVTQETKMAGDTGRLPRRSAAQAEELLVGSSGVSGNRGELLAKDPWALLPVIQACHRSEVMVVVNSAVASTISSVAHAL
jgi:hypothetical protein